MYYDMTIKKKFLIFSDFRIYLMKLSLNHDVFVESHNPFILIFMMRIIINKLTHEIFDYYNLKKIRWHFFHLIFSWIEDHGENQSTMILAVRKKVGIIELIHFQSNYKWVFLKFWIFCIINLIFILSYQIPEWKHWNFPLQRNENAWISIRKNYPWNSI